MSPRNGLAMHRRRLPIVIGLLAGGIALMPVAFAVGRRTTTSQHAPTPATSTTAARSSPSADFIEYRDEEARFAVSFPKDWTQFKSSDPQVRLAAAANDHDSLLIAKGESLQGFKREGHARARRVVGSHDGQGRGRTTQVKAKPGGGQGCLRRSWRNHADIFHAGNLGRNHGH